MKTTKFTSKWLSVIEDDGYFYSERPGVDSISVVVLRNTDEGLEIMFHKEVNVAHDRHRNVNIGAIGGALREGENPLTGALRELVEEGGFDIDTDDIHCLGKMFCTTQSSEHVHLFLADVTDYIQEEPQLEPGEQGENMWVPFDLKFINEIEDPRFVVTIARYLNEKGNKST
jgi:8-oxo-dGTP pyrophosphatase MutT (NUDIX family)